MRRPPTELAPSDEELAARSRSGDREAFGALYERHFPGLFDFAARMVHDREAAADVVQTTFTKGWIGLQKADTVRNVKAWLYTIARNAAIDELRHRKRELTPGEGDDDEPSVFAVLPAGAGSDPVAVAQDRELARLVWASASALGPADYSLLDLHVRRDLGPDELAEALGLSKGAVYTRLSRLRDSVEDTVVSSVLLRRGRRDCPELDRLLTSLGASELTRKVHRAIRAHRRECDRCEENRRKLVSPIAIFAGLSPVPAASGLAGAIWDRLASTLDGSPADAGALRPVVRVGRRTKMLVAAVVAAVVAASAAGVVALGGGPPPPEDPADVHSTTHEIGVGSQESVIEMAWSAVPGASAYSIEFSRAPEDLPDAVGDLPGSAMSAASPELAPGSWYFHLRTESTGGEWTNTVHVGPFVVEAAPAAAQHPELSIEGVLIQEPTSGRATATVLVSLSASSAEPVSASYGSIDGTAIAGEDYRPAEGTLSIPPGDTVASIEVVVLSDGEDEPDETLLIELADPVNATLADHRAEVTIVERAVRSTLSIGDTSALEGGAGSSSEAVFPLLLSATSEKKVTVRWETREGKAAAGVDFADSSGTATFPPGEGSAEIRVRILGDDLEEPDETFSVRLSNPKGARLDDDRGLGTIRDDDEPGTVAVPEISIADRSTTEGDTGTSTVALPVTLSSPSENTVTVQYTIAGGSARVGSDLQGGSGTVRFAPGATSARIAVQVIGDRVDEPDERFFVTLSAPQNAVLADGRGTGTIRDDDPAPALSIADASVEEGTGGNHNAQLTVRLSNPSSRRVTASFSTSPDSASPGADYVSATGTVAIAAGGTTARISVPIAGDRIDEPDETFVVGLSRPSGASIADGAATVTIRDDDPPPTISIRDASVTEGTGANQVVRLVLNLSDPSAFTVRVAFDTVPGSADARQDYLAASGTVTFAPGTTSATISVTIVADTLVEPDEAFTVALSNPSNATIGDGTAVVTILDDDGSTRGSSGTSSTWRTLFTIPGRP